MIFFSGKDEMLHQSCSALGRTRNKGNSGVRMHLFSLLTAITVRGTNIFIGICMWCELSSCAHWCILQLFLLVTRLCTVAVDSGCEKLANAKFL